MVYPMKRDASNTHLVNNLSTFHSTIRQGRKKFSKNIRGHLKILGTRWVTFSQFLIENRKQLASPCKLLPPRWPGGRDLCIPALWFINVFRNVCHQNKSCASWIQFTHVRSIFLCTMPSVLPSSHKHPSQSETTLILHNAIRLCGATLWTPSQNSKLHNHLSSAATILLFQSVYVLTALSVSGTCL